MAFQKTIRSLSNLVAIASRVGSNFTIRPGVPVAGVDPKNFPSANQPIAPMQPAGTEALGFPYLFGQNQQFTPRFDAEYSAPELRKLIMYPLARICAENVKNQVCLTQWTVHAKLQQGEKDHDRIKREKTDKNIATLTRFFERPNPEQSWDEWTRGLIEDMLSIDASTTLIRRFMGGKKQVGELRYIPGDNIARYIDDNGWTPPPPSPAYAQLWQGIPRSNHTTRELVYKPRNIIPRGSVSSFLYGCSCTEMMASELEIGIARLLFIKAYYDKGSIPGALQVVPYDTPPAKVLEAMQIMNSDLAGNLEARRQWRMIQGFNKDGKADQILFPKEPLLEDPFDDLHIRKVAYGYGTSPQRLLKPMNRASAQTSQQASEEEGLLPFQDWLANYVTYIIQVQMGYVDYELTFDTVREIDPDKQADIDVKYANACIRPRNEIRADHGWDLIDMTEMNEPGQCAANGFMPIDQHVPIMGADGNVPTDKMVTRTSGSEEDLAKRIVKYINDEGRRMIENRREHIVVETRKDARSRRDEERVVLLGLLDIDWSTLADDVAFEFEAIAEEAASESLNRLGVHATDIVAAARERARLLAAARAAELVGMKLHGGVPEDNPDAKRTISATTRDAIHAMVTEAFASDMKLEGLAQKMTAAGIFGADRAAIIARTESQGLGHMGTMEGWKASGIVTHVKWTLNPDHPENCECDCEYIAEHGPYPLGELPDYPQHPHEMCILTPVLSTTTKVRRKQMAKATPKAIQAEYSIKKKVEKFLAKLARECSHKLFAAASPQYHLPVNGKVNGVTHA